MTNLELQNRLITLDVFTICRRSMMLRENTFRKVFPLAKPSMMNAQSRTLMNIWETLNNGSAIIPFHWSIIKKACKSEKFWETNLWSYVHRIQSDIFF